MWHLQCSQGSEGDLIHEEFVITKVMNIIIYLTTTDLLQCPALTASILAIFVDRATVCQHLAILCRIGVLVYARN